MTAFKRLDFPTYNLLPLPTEGWSGNQIGITTTKDHPNDTSLACGSMKYDWSKAYWCDKERKQVVPLRDVALTEEQFDTIATPFKGTVFEEIYRHIRLRHKIGRVRLMKMKPNTCLSWHTDGQIRLHYPIETYDGCFMVIGDEVKHLPKNEWWLTNTHLPHTAFNGSRKERTHLVVNVLEGYDEI